MNSSVFGFGQVHCCKQVVSKKRMANSVDPDETAHNGPSHLDLHCLQRCLVWLED